MPRQPEYGSDVIVDLLRDAGIEFVAFNPGATFRGIHDSLVNYAPQATPEIIICCHEEISVAIAHGYAKATGKPMAAIVHNIVGLQHASMAIYNAWCDRVPMLVLGGTGPMDWTRRRPRIDWIHTALVQGNQIRDYVKWDDQPHNLNSVPESFWRALRLTTTQPMAPVYICYDVSIQEQALTPEDLLHLPIPDAARLQPPIPPAAPVEVVNEIAESLLEARWPVIVADRCGRHHGSMSVLVELADLLAIPVIDCGGRMNFPSEHPLDMTGNEAECLGQADLILALDVSDLHGALRGLDKLTRETVEYCVPGTRIIAVSLDEYLVRSWAADYQRLQPTDRTIAADTAVFLPALLSVCRAKLPNTPEHVRQRIAERYEQVRMRHESLRALWRRQAERAETRSSDRPSDRAGLLPETLALYLGQMLNDYDWSLVNGNLGSWPRRLWNFDRPYRYLGGSGGSGIGYGSGASLGAALAFRDTGRLCVDIQSDGDLLYTPSSLWTAAHHKIPLLMVMNNNRSYYNSEEHAYNIARIRNRPIDNKGIGTYITNPEVDFAALARSQGVTAFGPIDDVAQLEQALEEAIKRVLRGEPVLVDVHTRPF